jgi:hypothetical protein
MTPKSIRFRSFAAISVLVVPTQIAGCSSNDTGKTTSGSHTGDAAAGGGSSGGIGGASAGGSGTGGANAGGSGTGGGASTACTQDKECQILSDYCTGCDCRALGAKESLPKCGGPGVNCLVDPCRGKVAACLQGACVSQATPSGT